MTHAPAVVEPPVQRASSRRVSRPHDAHEHEAKRAADVVARGGSVASWSFTTVPPAAPAPVQRDEADTPKSGEDKAKEALTKAGEAALETEPGKALKEKVLADPVVKAVKDAIESPAGLATIVGGLAVTGQPLPIQPPKFKLDRIMPGLEGGVIWKGPVAAPTEVGIVLTFKSPGSGPKRSEADRRREETVRLAAADAAFRRNTTFTPGSKEAEEQQADEEAVKRYVTSRIGALPGFGSPLIPLKPGPPQPAPPAPGAVQRCAGTPCDCGDRTVAVTDDHDHVDEALATPSQPLPGHLAREMAARFGQDFSRVRVHADGLAVRSADALDARAYTVGERIVLGSESPDLETEDGRRLLAHELTHVVQQRGSTDRVDRQGAKPGASKGSAAAKREDVVILLDDTLAAEASTLAPGAVPIKAATLDDLAKQLKAIKTPIATLYIISHSLPSGDLLFGSQFERPEVVAKKLTGTIAPALAPASLDFRGCTIGSAPEAMEQMRAAVGAARAVAGTCYLVTQDNGPIVLNDKTAVTKRSQVTPNNRAEFELGLPLLRDSFGPAKKCILRPTEDAYFDAGGKWVAQWFNPVLSKEWDVRKSKCYSEVAPETVDAAKTPKIGFDLTGHCRLIRVEGKTP
jgi:hypothetical protein